MYISVLVKCISTCRLCEIIIFIVNYVKKEYYGEKS